jgi:hypothetical protein
MGLSAGRRDSDVPEAIRDVAVALQNALLVFENLDNFFVENGNTVVIAQLSEGYQGGIRDVVEDVCGCGFSGKAGMKG